MGTANKESFTLISGAGNGTTGSDNHLKIGGYYHLRVVGTVVTESYLDVLGPDGSTYVPSSAIVGNTSTLIILGPGIYRFRVVTGTDVSASLTRAPIA